MTQVLEATMLICFGFSWPMSVYKNYKARTAKSMSLPFTLLIISGYIAGISAKIYSHTFNYVLVVYILNLLIVSANVAVYFINRKHDNESEPEPVLPDISCDPVTDERILTEVRRYKKMNKTAKNNGIVFFGSNYFYDLAAGELAETFEIDAPVYNRSIKNLSVESAVGVIDECLTGLDPEKIFINVGDEDIKDPSLDIDGFILKYQWMLYDLHRKSNARIYIVSVISESSLAAKINERLAALAEETGCEYVNATKILNNEEPDAMFFEIIRRYTRRRPLTFGEAMNIG